MEHIVDVAPFVLVVVKRIFKDIEKGPSIMEFGMTDQMISHYVHILVWIGNVVWMTERALVVEHYLL